MNTDDGLVLEDVSVKIENDSVETSYQLLASGDQGVATVVQNVIDRRGIKCR